MDVMMRDAWLVFQSAIAVLYCVTAGAHAHAATEPAMVSIPAGALKHSKPVAVASFELGKFEVTVGQFREFVKATKYKTDAERVPGESGCWMTPDGLRQSSLVVGYTWQGLGKPHPIHTGDDTKAITCVSWKDTKAYIAWLNKVTGKTYRLPTDAEWEYAARANRESSLPWGSDKKGACSHENIADLTIVVGKSMIPWQRDVFNCKDGYEFVAPVGKFKANAFGLHDMMGNVQEWVEGCYEPPKTNAPCELRTLRGGSYATVPIDAILEKRMDQSDDLGLSTAGFRLARSLP
jgi:formylglycine-generating enzyme required for sulfatase activity